MSSKSTEFVSGKLYWAKVLGKPVFNKFKDANEWSFEFEPDKAGIAVLKKHGLIDRLKDKYEDRGKYISLRKTEFNNKGEPNTPIRIYAADDTEWDQTKLIGNGSTADIKLDIRDYGAGKKKGIYPVAIRVTDLVKYESSEFGRMDTGDRPAPGTKAPDFSKDFGLDDEIPIA